MSVNQPSSENPMTNPAVRASSVNDREEFVREVRLLDRWLRLNELYTVVTAHGDLGGTLPDEDALLEAKLVTETRLVEETLHGHHRLAEVESWEAGLLHPFSAADPSLCLVCRRAQFVPDALPIEYVWAIEVIRSRDDRPGNSQAVA